MQMQEYQLDFVTYCVGNLADRLNMSASKVYKMLRSTDILNGYMIPCYDVLHTFGKEYIMDDLINLLKKRGALKWKFITHQLIQLDEMREIPVRTKPPFPNGVPMLVNQTWNVSWKRQNSWELRLQNFWGIILTKKRV